MNSFANTLFAMLFGWARSVIQRVWSAAAEGRLGGFFTWLGDHWLWVALIVCLLCTAADFIVWFIRWQPYLVWRTRWRAFLRFLRGDWRRKKQFEQGYRDAVVPQDLRYAAAEAPAPQAPLAVEMEWAPPVQEEYAPPAAMDTQRQRLFVPEEAPAPIPAEEEYTPYPEQAAVRRRRSDKYDKKRSAWQQRLKDIAKEDVGMLDGLPPAVDREAAFHEPVYPNQPTVTPAPSVWQGTERSNGSGA